MAGNPILAEVSDKFGASMTRMPVGFYGLGQTSDLMRTWKAWYSLSMQATRLAWDAQAVVALRCMQIARENARGRQSETHRMLTEKIATLLRHKPRLELLPFVGAAIGSQRKL
jgi:hypothetical protein